MTPAKSIRPGRKSVVVLAVLYLLLLGVIGAASEWFVQTPDHSFPDKGKAKAIVVFYADEVAERKRRVATATSFSRRSTAFYLLMVGGYRPERNGYIGAREMRNDAMELGIDQNRILHDSRSNDSLSNLEGALRLIDETGFQNADVFFVSDRLHLLRLSLAARWMNMPQPITLVPTEDHGYGLLYFIRLNHELMGYVALVMPRSMVATILNLTRRA